MSITLAASTLGRGLRFSRGRTESQSQPRHSPFWARESDFRERVFFVSVTHRDSPIEVCVWTVSRVPFACL